MECYEKENHLISQIRCHNDQLKNFYKFMPMNINQQIITLNIHKTVNSLV